MPAFSGSFTGTVRGQSMVSAFDQPDHILGLAGISGTQKSADEKWNNSTVPYWGITDATRAPSKGKSPLPGGRSPSKEHGNTRAGPEISARSLARAPSRLA